MMRSLFAGVSGLKNHQTRMDVIGNNIANVNTVGFKKSRVTFQDMLSQSLRGASSPTATRGGVNPLQVGLGMTLASIDVIHTPGSPQSTGKNTDLSIEGEGFFMVGEGDNIFYTRAGNFDFDYNKTFINTSNGMVVKGILADADGLIDPKGAITDINLASQVSSPPKATSLISYSKNLDSRAGFAPSGSASGVKPATPNDLEINLAANLPVTKIAVRNSAAPPGVYLADTSYDFDYNTGMVTILDGEAGVIDGQTYIVEYYNPTYQSPMEVYDSKGDVHRITVYYTKTANNTWEVDTSVTTKSVTTFLTSGKGVLIFDTTTGKLTAGSSVTNAAVDLSAVGADNLDIALNFSNLTEYAGEFTSLAFSQNGYTAGDLQGVSVDTTGTITGSFSNGQSRKLAQIAIATFANPGGLLKVGNNLFQVSNNSGEPDKGIPGVGGRGVIKPETLEMSNVDLSQEFVDMIITQRGFQANSRVITTSDQILEELVNLRR